MQTTLFEKVKKSTYSLLHSKIDIQLVLDASKSGELTNPETGEIINLIDLTEKARTALKTFGKDSDQYDQAKTKLPAITPNGYHSDQPFTDETLIPNGLIYVDLDDQGIDHDYIRSMPSLYAYWPSTSGKGFSLLFRAKNYVKDEIPNVIKAICSEYKFNNCKKAEKIGQPLIIPYAPELWSKTGTMGTGIEDSFELYSFDDNSKNRNYGSLFKKERGIITQTSGFSSNPERRLQYKSYITDYQGYTITQETEDYIYIQDGLPFYEIFLGIAENYKIKVGSRSRRLRTVCAILLTLNQWAPEELILQCINQINRDKCQRPLDQKEVEGIVRNIFNQFKAGKLDVSKYEKTKYIWFKKSSKLSKREKLQVVGQLTGERRKGAMKDLIEKTIEFLYSDGKKITQKEVANTIKKDERTIRKYWTDEIKETVREYNQDSKKKTTKAPEPEVVSTPDDQPITTESLLKKISQVAEEVRAMEPAVEPKKDQESAQELDPERVERVIRYIREYGFTSPINLTEDIERGFFIKEVDGFINLYLKGASGIALEAEKRYLQVNKIAA